MSGPICSAEPERDRARRRIVLYSDSAGSSGAEAVFADLARALVAAPEVALTIAVAYENTTLRADVAQLTTARLLLVPQHPPRIAPLGLWNPRRGVALRRLLGHEQADAVILNLPSVESGAAPLVWAASPRTAMLAIFHVHHRIAFAASGRPMARTRDRMIGPVLRRLDHAWGVSPDAPRSMIADWGLDPDRCSTLALPERRLERVERGRARRELGLPPDGSLIGIVGRVEVAHKGHDTFVQAARRIADTRPDVGFVVVGDGPDVAAVGELVAAAGLTERFHFLGRVRPPDVAYGALDLIALPSRFEGLPLVALEALGLGLAGAATGVDGLRAVWPAEWTVAEDDPEALASTLQRLLSMSFPERAQVLEAARDRARVFLTQDQAADVIPVVEAAVRRHRTG